MRLNVGDECGGEAVVVARPDFPSARVLRVGLALFALGLLAIAVDVAPFFFGDHNTSLWLNLSCLLAPAGFAVVVISAVRTGRRSQRQALADVDEPSV
jgi:peptidoglycan/LPS O-acetylase OafA/YrhL